MSQTSDLRAYLETLAAQVGPDSVPGHILNHGRGFEATELLADEEEFVSRIKWKDCAIKQCWRNSQSNALTLPETAGITLRYVEGYVLPPRSMVIEHAWLSVNGKVVDTTIRITGETYTRVRGIFPAGWEYWGVEMDPQVCVHALEHNTAVALIDDFECGWPIIPERYAKTKRRSRAA